MRPSPHRRAILASAAAALLASTVRAQTGARVQRVVFVPTQGGARLHRRTPDGPANVVRWVYEMLADEGLRKDRDVLVEYVDIELTSDDPATIERRARALLASAPDAILVGEDGVEPLKRLTAKIPLVFYQFSGDPVALGLVESYRRPGGNVTGSTLVAPGGDEKGWELLRQLAPKAKRLGVMWREEELSDPWFAKDKERLLATSARLGFEYVEIVIPKAAKFAPIEPVLRAAKVDALIAEETDEDWIPDLMRFVRRERIPALWPNAMRVRQGGLCSASPATGEAMRDAVAMVALILRGASPATMPLRVPTRFVTAINVKTAREMGLVVPPAVRLRANVVVEN